ncbi:MAG TPA: hypothetical protein VIO38_07240 [Rariglobus sp.]
MSLREAAEQTPWKDTKVLRAAITQPKDCPWPPLAAKRGSRGEYLIPAHSLQEWIEALPDA